MPTNKAMSLFRHDELIVNYNDALVYGRDLKLLENGSDWLNSSVVWFVFQRLQAKQPHNMTFMDPSVLSFFMHQMDDQEDVEDFAANLLGNRLVLAVNDTHGSNSSLGTGSHWSLLVFDDGDSSWHHFDSSKGHNQAAARVVANKFLSAWKKKTTSTVSLNCDTFTEWDVPQQTNGYDCGVHMLAAAAQCINNESFSGQIVVEGLEKLFHESPGYCGILRRQIADDVRSLATKKA